VEHYAQGKLQAKSLNMIAANQVGNGELGFESEQNALSVYWHGGKQELPRTSKSHLARQLISLIAEKIA
jgi:phosphopantothenoylcysteine decarboxylase/phosphopantothenate--cysteine ligase